MYLCAAYQTSTLKRDPGKLETLQVVDIFVDILSFSTILSAYGETSSVSA